MPITLCVFLPTIFLLLDLWNCFNFCLSVSSPSFLGLCNHLAMCLCIMFYADRVISKESKRRILIRISCDVISLSISRSCKGPFPTDFHTKILYHHNNIWRWIEVLKRFVKFLCHLDPHSSKHCSQYPVLKYPRTAIYRPTLRHINQWYVVQISCP
jgi:hypothetical protein